MSKRNRKNGGLVSLAKRIALPRPKSNNNSKLVDKGAPAPPKSVRQQVWKVWQVFWAFGGPIIAVNGLWFTMTPSIAIEPSVNIDPAKIYATQILVTNRGHVPVYDVKVDCGIGMGGGQTVLNGIMHRPDIRPIACLDAGEAITRSCDVGSIDIQGKKERPGTSWCRTLCPDALSARGYETRPVSTPRRARRRCARNRRAGRRGSFQGGPSSRRSAATAARRLGREACAASHTRSCAIEA